MYLFNNTLSPYIENKMIEQDLNAFKKFSKNIMNINVCPVLVNSLYASNTCNINIVSMSE